MSVIRVAVSGAGGRMGREVLAAVSAARDLELVGAVDRGFGGASCRDLCGEDVPDLVVEEKLGALLDTCKPDVLVDFTHGGVAPSHALSALQRGISPVIGTSGLGFEDVNAIRDACEQYSTPGILVPNFAIGAVLMMKFATLAAPYMPYCEVVEMHHEKKIDSPSGTAMYTAELISGARAGTPDEVSGAIEKVEGARGARSKGVRVHSVRMPGFVASQEVLFGSDGERLSLRHDSMDRKSFMPGVVLACREIRNRTGFMVGLDALMF